METTETKKPKKIWRRRDVAMQVRFLQNELDLLHAIAEHRHLAAAQVVRLLIYEEAARLGLGSS